MPDDTPRAHYWQRMTDGHGKWHRGEPPPGADLAALRRGLGKDPGAVPQMWPFYTTLDVDGRLTCDLWAEHAALTLFAVHQQSKAQPMHQTGTGFGTAALALRRHDRFSEPAVNRRFAAAATATSPTELAMHMRGLVTQLRLINQPVDYTQLFRDLRDWHDPERAPLVRRRWGAQYFVWSPRTDGAEDTDAPVPA